MDEYPIDRYLQKKDLCKLGFGATMRLRKNRKFIEVNCVHNGALILLEFPIGTFEKGDIVKTCDFSILTCKLNIMRPDIRREIKHSLLDSLLCYEEAFVSQKSIV